MQILSKEKDPPVLEHQTDRKGDILNASIPQGAMPENIAKRKPIPMAKFRLYLEAVLILLNAREIVQ